MATPLGERVREGMKALADEAEATMRYVAAYGAEDLRAVVTAPPEIAGDLFDAAKQAANKLLKRDGSGPLTTDTFLGRT